MVQTMSSQAGTHEGVGLLLSRLKTKQNQNKRQNPDVEEKQLRQCSKGQTSQKGLVKAAVTPVYAYTPESKIKY